MYKKFGACVAPGKKIWWIKGKKLNVGKVTKVEHKRVLVETNKGTVPLSPLETFMVTLPAMTKKK